MSFGDFVIRYEHTFLRNIYTNKQIQESYHIKDLESYYGIFEEYIAICVGLSAFLNNLNRNDFINQAVEKFVRDKFYGDEITDIKNTIAQTEIKNALSSTYWKVQKFNLKIYTYVYHELIYFPRSDIGYETITTNKFFINVYRLINVKFHLHHSHITGKIFGYAYDFCNMAVIEKTTLDIPFIAHNLFAFDLYYFIKGYITSAWCSKVLNIGDTTHPAARRLSVRPSDVKGTSQMKQATRSQWNVAKTSQWYVFTTSYSYVAMTSHGDVMTTSYQYVSTTSQTSLK